MNTSVSAPVQTATRGRFRWRVVDIVVASVVAVASGVVFWLWNTGYRGPDALLDPLLPGISGLLNGPWLFAAVLVALIVRKPGAALFGEIVAASVSTLLGSYWGFEVLTIGIVQGVGAEIVFAIFLYRRWNLPVAILAGAAAGVGCALYSLLGSYIALDGGFKLVYFITTVISGAVIAGLGSWLVVKALAATGALNRFASGRDARELV